jgi:pyruvate/2-oxoglutarate dehydrogenase complex dihydrolipoamide acyltransferase (E2) component
VAYEFRLPDLGEGLTEGEVARWLVSEGQVVAEDDPLVEIQTDKTTVEIPSPAAGTVDRILVGEGDVVPVGTALVVIADGASPADDAQPGAEQAPQQAAAAAARPALQQTVASGGSVTRIRATPLVRRLADELGVDLATVAATGPLGRVTEEDVRSAAAEPPLQHSGASSRMGAGAPPGDERREPLRGVRRLIAEHMARAHREVPPVTWVEECDFARVPLDRLLPTLLRACALSLQEFPELNARLEGEEIVLLERYNLGLAVQTDRGLLVPVVRRCHERSPDELAAEVERLAEGARAGSLAAEDLRGSTFTVTSAGKLAGLFQTPIVNHPEVAILSVGRVAERPVVRDGSVTVAPMGHIALTFDHRVVDGARAAAFGLDVISRLEAGS